MKDHFHEIFFFFFGYRELWKEDDRFIRGILRAQDHPRVAKETFLRRGKMLNFERNRVENVERVCAACFVATRFLRNSTSPPSPPPSRINCGVEIREENLEGEEGEKKRREKKRGMDDERIERRVPLRKAGFSREETNKLGRSRQSGR